MAWSYVCKQIRVGLLHAKKITKVVLINLLNMGFPASLLWDSLVFFAYHLFSPSHAFFLEKSTTVSQASHWLNEVRGLSAYIMFFLWNSFVDKICLTIQSYLLSEIQKFDKIFGVS